jgi:hypothetical protein
MTRHTHRQRSKTKTNRSAPLVSPRRRPSTVGPGSHFLVLNLILLQDRPRTTSTSDCPGKAKVEVKVERPPASSRGTAALRPPPGNPATGNARPQECTSGNARLPRMLLWHCLCSPLYTNNQHKTIPILAGGGGGGSTFLIFSNFGAAT